MNDWDELYMEVILDHNKNPRNIGEIPDHTHRCLLYTSDAADE